MQYKDQVALGCNQETSNETQEENTNIGRYELDLENLTDLEVDLNDLMNDHEENTFGISLYEDLIDINSIEVGRSNSNIQKTVENEVTLKSRIEKVLVVYKVDCQRPGTTVLYEENNVDFGFSNDLIGTGTLILEKVQDPDAFALTWEGNLLECFASNVQEFQEVSRYSFLVDYMIDIRLKVIQDDEFFILIKSDFQLENETVFLQFSFNSQEKANFWYEHLSKYKQQALKRISSDESVSQGQSKKFKENLADSLNSNSKNEALLSGNSQVPKISIPFFRDKKQSKKVNNVPNTLNYYQSENLFPLIRHEDKVFIENQIRDLIFSNNTGCQDADDNIAKPLSLDFESSNKSIIQQKCTFIKFVVNSIQTNNNLETKSLSLPSSSLYKSIQSSSSCENTLKFQSSKENIVNNNPQPSTFFTCQICYENYNYNDIITLEPCGHQICFNCENKLADSKCPWDRSKYTIKQ